ncbi:hypothetical protein BDW75DRAFT_249675 [Aspergillus navahoensis]
MLSQLPLELVDAIADLHIRTCIPANVLDAQGYFMHYQKQICCLSLITDGTCPHAGQHLEGLSCFTALTELEWEGIQHLSKVSALRGCLQQNSRHLKALSIRFLLAENPPGCCGYTDIVDLFPSSFRDDCAQPDLDSYSLLTLWTLSRILFPSTDLRDCPNNLCFLQLLAQSSTPVSLHYFEISSDYLRELGERLISNFPQFLPGLDNAIHHHQSTLRGLVFHEHRLMAVDSKQIFEELRDYVTVTLPSIPRILQKICSLITLGLCLCPASAVLHLRFSGKERIHHGLRREIISQLQKDLD